VTEYVSEEEYEILIAAAVSLNEYVKVVHDAPRSPTATNAGNRPGDDFNRRGDWSDILTPHGWKCVRSFGSKAYWRRPDKDGRGISATTGHCHTDFSGELFYPFSTNAHPFEAEESYSKFACFTTLNYGGDFITAAKALADAGWGTPPPTLDLIYGSSSISSTPGPTPTPSACGGIPTSEKIILRASEVTPKRMEWLWPWRIPLGKLIAFAGPGGIGKTMVLLDLAARVTMGAEWPFCGGETAKPGQVLYLSAEDEPEDTLVPRLIQAGADLNRIVFLKNAVLDYWTMVDLKTLDRALQECGEVSMVVFDPPTSFLGDVDDHKNAELRRLFNPLKSWSAKNRLSLVLNTHINKAANSPDAASRVIGSVAWVNAPRACYMFTKDADDPSRRLFSLFKQNLGPEQPSLVYRLVLVETPLGPQARVEWVEEIDVTAEQALAKRPDKQTQRVMDACTWLVARFREQLEWACKDLFERAKHDGISRNALFEARTVLNLPRAYKNRLESGDQEFFWHVPPDWPHLKGNCVVVPPQNGNGTHDFEVRF
jgi:putative DNA primase/helicase